MTLYISTFIKFPRHTFKNHTEFKRVCFSESEYSLTLDPSNSKGTGLLSPPNTNPNTIKRVS